MNYTGSNFVNIENKVFRKNLIKYFSIIFCVSLVLAMSFSFLVNRINKSIKKAEYEARQRSAVDLVSASLSMSLYAFVSDIRILSKSGEVYDILQSKNEHSLRRLSSIFSNWMIEKSRYTQLRYIDENGMEIVRVDRSHDKIMLIGKDSLQDKSQRYYFLETAKLKENSVYLSRFDLNVENGEIEKPYRPMIRIAMPLFHNGKRKGLLIINYHGDGLLASVKRIFAPNKGIIKMLDHEGYRILGEDKSKEWGFMFTNENLRYSVDNPFIWEKIKNSEKGNFYTKDGLYTFSTVRPPSQSIVVSDIRGSSYFWKIVSFLPNKEMFLTGRKYFSRYFLADIMIIIFISILSAIVSYGLAYRKIVREKLEKLSVAVSQSPFSVMITDIKRRIEYTNDMFKKVTAYDFEEVVGKTPRFLHSGHTPEETYESLNKTLELGNIWQGEFYNKRKDGRLYWEKAVIAPVRDSSKKITHYVAMKEDITERKAERERLAESEERYRSLIRLAPSAIILVFEGKIQYINPAGVKVLRGKSGENMIGKEFIKIIHPDDLQVDVENATISLENNLSSTFKEVRVNRCDGEIIYTLMGAVDFVYEGKVAYQVIIQDITDRKEAEIRLEHLAHYDLLTGVPNRMLFYERLFQALALANRNKSICALLFMDLDGFKSVNDRYGHDAGDEVLKVVAERIGKCLRAYDTLSRIGGDEFTVILSSLNNKKEAERIGERIIQSVNEGIIYNEHTLSVGVSIGIAFYPENGENTDSLISASDEAMYRSKQMGKNTISLF